MLPRRKWPSARPGVFHGRDTQGTKLPRVACFRNEYAPDGSRPERASSQVLADLVEERHHSALQDLPDRDPVYARRPRAAISPHAGVGDSEVPEICYQTPELLEHVAQVFLTLRVQRALHVLEPKSVLLGCHIHGLPQRPQRCTHLLPAFAMCTALPCSDYYEGSAPRPRHHRAWRLAGCFGPGARLKVLTFPKKTLGAVGGQLCPWQLWPSVASEPDGRRAGYTGAPDRTI